jgi:outer membrane protein TolC
VLTEAISPPSSTTAYDREDLVQKALAKRQDLLSARVGLQADDLGITQATDQLRPNVSLTGSYLSSGRGGDAFARTGLLGADQNITMIPGGFWDALSGMWTFNTTTWMFGLNVILPLRDRAGQAGMATALVKKKSDALILRSLEQGVRLNVLTAISQVEASRESVKLAGVRRDLAQKQLDATKLEYDLGTTTMYFVLDAQTKLTTAESSVVNEMINSRRNELNLLRVTGQLLEERGIAVQ